MLTFGKGSVNGGEGASDNLVENKGNKGTRTTRTTKATRTTRVTRSCQWLVDVMVMAIQKVYGLYDWKHHKVEKGRMWRAWQQKCDERAKICNKNIVEVVYIVTNFVWGHVLLQYMTHHKRFRQDARISSSLSAILYEDILKMHPRELAGR